MVKYQLVTNLGAIGEYPSMEELQKRWKIFWDCGRRTMRGSPITWARVDMVTITENVLELKAKE